MLAKRNTTIDMLRGLGLFCVILIHSLAYYLKYPFNHALWNFLQFSVPVFVFCSGYLFFKKDFQIENFNFLSYLKKRLVRLAQPYYIYAPLLLGLMFLFEPNKINFKYILETFLIVGGIDINWLVLLFLQLSLVLIFLRWSIKKNQTLFYGYTFLTIFSTIYLLILPSPVPYKMIMWLPWSLIMIYCYFFTLQETNKKFMIGSTLIFAFLYIFSLVVKKELNDSLVFFNNKYPPNIYYLSFGLMLLNTLYVVIQEHPPRLLESALNFLSKYSYTLFFIHHGVLYLFTKLFNFNNQLHWTLFFLVILGTSLVVQLGLNKIQTYGIRK